jgi:hypothetical protein
MAAVRVWFTLQGYFVFRSKPFRRPEDVTHFAHGVVGKLAPRTTRLCACRLALSKMASNLEGTFSGS